MRPRKTGGWIPTDSLSPEERSEIRDRLEPHLRDAGDSETAMAACERAIQRHAGLLEGGINEKPQSKKVSLAELQRLQEAAEVMVTVIEGLDPEKTADRWWPNPSLPPGTLRSAADLCAHIAAAAALFRDRLELEGLPKGRPKDLAARSLAYQLSLIWRRMTDAPMTRPRDTTTSAWFDFVVAVFRIAGTETKGEGYARDLVDHWRTVEESHSGNSR